MSNIILVFCSLTCLTIVLYHQTAMEWGAKLAAIRKAKRLSQSVLAEKSGLNRGHIARMETGLIPTVTFDTYKKLAAGLDMPLDAFMEQMGESSPAQDTPEQILERLRLATPISIPIVRDFPMRAGEPYDAQDYVYLPRARAAARKGLEAYIVDGNCLSPDIENKDVVIIDRERTIEQGDIVAVLYQGQMHLGKIKKIADETYIENSHGRFKLKDCPIAAPVIQVVRRLK